MGLEKEVQSLIFRWPGIRCSPTPTTAQTRASSTTTCPSSPSSFILSTTPALRTSRFSSMRFWRWAFFLQIEFACQACNIIIWKRPWCHLILSLKLFSVDSVVCWILYSLIFLLMLANFNYNVLQLLRCYVLFIGLSSDLARLKFVSSLSVPKDGSLPWKAGRPIGQGLRQQGHRQHQQSVHRRPRAFRQASKSSGLGIRRWVSTL